MLHSLPGDPAPHPTRPPAEPPPLNYGFLIDNRSCIGCHACSTACKAENEVPLGVYRTWVKYVEKGAFPNTRRAFQVTRCNHCANPPCVRICPVTAMYQRDDGIVEFDPDACIGCKACLQACPYDAIHIDPNTGTAAKCHFCSHRTDIGLAPACVVVCPTQAIIAGDLDDPGSRISELVARHDVTVRRPEQGTLPKLFYIDADQITLSPGASQAPDTFMWADTVSEQAIYQEPAAHGGGGSSRRTAPSGAALRAPHAQGGTDAPGPIHIGTTTVAEHMVQTGYNAQHKVPWHWPVPAYLVTKAIGSGAFMLLAAWFGLGVVPFEIGLALAGGLLALVFTALTTALLVVDLERPERFLTILLRPQWRSWLTRGAFILIGFTAVAGLWWLAELGGALRLIPDGLVSALRAPLLLLGGGLAAAAATYTAWLFGQAEGRDLWQSPTLPLHLLTQAFAAGAAGLMLLTFAYGHILLAMNASPEGAVTSAVFERISALDGAFAVSSNVLLVAVAASLLIILLGDVSMSHQSETAARAAHRMRRGRYRTAFWAGGIGLGHAVPLLALLATFVVGQSLAAPLLVVAAAATILGLYAYEYAFVMAPQEIPNS